MKRGGTGVGVGASSVLMVFVLLCLTTFATLSLVSANADYRLMSRASETIQRFYTADAEAERTLAELSAILRESRSAATEAEYRDRYTREGASLADNIVFEGTTARFSVAMGETQCLEVVLQLPYGEETLYRKLQWQVIPTNWQSEEDSAGINIWSGGFDMIPVTYNNEEQ